MKEFVDAIGELITDHWVKFVTAAGFALAGWILAQWRAHRAWQRREFFNRINFSLNSIQDETLLIRTLSEKTCSDIFLNEVATQQLIRAAQATTENDPIVPLPKQDAWFFLNSVVNELSEQFAGGLIAREAGENVKSVAYLTCLTNECDGELRTRKVRAMVIRKDLLTKLPKETPKFESPNHKRRWITLQQLQAAYSKEPWKFMEFELVH